MVNKFYTVLIIFVALVFAGMFFSMKAKDTELAKLQVENFKLNDKLQQMVSVNGNTVKVLYRDKDVIKYVNTYVPPEGGGATITTDTNNHVTVTYNKFGVGFFPYIGAAYTNKLEPEVGARVFYFDRYGASISLIPNKVTLGIDTRIEYGVVKNSAIGLFITNDKSFGVSWKTFL